MSDRELQRPEVTRPGEGPELRITNVPEPLSVDQQRRMRSYLIKMTVRVVSFIMAFISWRLGWPVAVTFILMSAAAVLPYFAVISVNTGRDGRDTDTSFRYTHPVQRLTAGEAPETPDEEGAPQT
ncbi:hypothetical protein GCM10010401_21460 [Rarobacter faecitabidus]|uniref:DUF3099 family protein n=1 Tax=Rarobacter faecitabidus TaxID=13243 RepID=A0A542ZVY8_RARFA|nr:DUF3099 domain-containing protein [Rarobacter faecitabidus]TQL64350.1 DUF3099 family protein [Rarobacter faecitabidus]